MCVDIAPRPDLLLHLVLGIPTRTLILSAKWRGWRVAAPGRGFQRHTTIFGRYKMCAGVSLGALY